MMFKLWSLFCISTQARLSILYIDDHFYKKCGFFLCSSMQKRSLLWGWYKLWGLSSYDLTKQYTIKWWCVYSRCCWKAAAKLLQKFFSETCLKYKHWSLHISRYKICFCLTYQMYYVISKNKIKMATNKSLDLSFVHTHTHTQRACYYYITPKFIHAHQFFCSIISLCEEQKQWQQCIGWSF